MAHRHHKVRGLGQTRGSTGIPIAGLDVQLSAVEGARGIDLEAQVDRLAGTDAGEDSIQRRATSRPPTQLLPHYNGVRAGLPVHRIRAHLGRPTYIREAHRQRLGERGGVDAEETRIAHRHRDRAGVAGINGRHCLVGVEENRRRQFHAGLHRPAALAGLAQAALRAGKAVGQVGTADNLRRIADGHPLLGLDHRQVPGDQVGGRDGGHAGHGAQGGSDGRSHVAQAAAQNVGQDDAVGRPRAGVVGDQRPGDHVAVGVDDLGELGQNGQRRNDGRRTQGPTGVASLAIGVVIGATVIIVQRSLEGRSAASAAELHPQLHRARGGGGKGVGVVPVIALCVGCRIDGCGAGEAQDVQDVVGRRRHINHRIVGRHGRGALRRQGDGVDAAGGDVGREAGKAQGHRRGQGLDEDALFDHAVHRALGVARHAQVQVGPVVPFKIRAGSGFGHRRLIGNPHRGPGDGDGAGGRDVGDHQPPADDRRREDGCAGEDAIAHPDRGGAGDVGLVGERLGKDHPLPGGGDDEGAGEGIGVGVDVGRVAADRHGGRNLLVGARHRLFALEVGRGLRRGSLETVLAIGRGGGDDVGRLRAAILAAGGGVGRGKDGVEGHRAAQRPGDVGDAAHSEDAAARRIHHAPAGRHPVGDDDVADDAVGVHRDSRRDRFAPVDLGGHGLVHAQLPGDVRQLPGSGLG